MFNINNCFLFNNCEIPAGEISEITDNKTFKKGEIIYSAENYKKALGIIIKGKAAAFSDSNTPLSFFKEGGVFGGAALFGGENYVTVIKAESETKVAFIYEENLLKTFSNYPETAVNYIKYLSEKVRFLSEKVSMLTLNGVTAKVYGYLSKVNRTENINISKLAKSLNIGRTSIYRAISELSKKGLIEKTEIQLF